MTDVQSPITASEQLQILLDDESGAVCTFGPVIYIVWRSPDSMTPIAVSEDAVKTLIKRYGPGRKLMHVHRVPDRPGGFRTDPGVRDAVLRHFAQCEEYFAAAALAIEAKGFGGSIIRSVTAGVFLVRRTSVKTEAFKDARDGVRWLAGQAGEYNRFSAEDMVRSLERHGMALSSVPRIG